MNKEGQRICAEIDMGAMLRNTENMHRHLKPETKMLAVIKANGYGHGAVEIAQVLQEVPYIWGFATATFEEALDLRRAGCRKPILILGYVFPYCYTELDKEGIRPTVFRDDQLQEMSRAAAAAGQNISVHVAVDTGMSRIGIRPDETGLAFVKRALQMPGITVEGIFTHFARADEADKTSAEKQYRLFTGFLQRIKEETGYRIPICHASNSAAIIEEPDWQLDMVRAGIILYGMWPSEEVRRDILPLEPVLSLHSHIVYIKEVPAGTPVSYGGTFVTQKPTMVATIPVGYADGYPRSLSNKGYVLIHGKKAPVLGRVCMDQMMVDVTDIPEAAINDHVTLIGKDKEASITMEELGALSGRFNYELACDINQRVPRFYSHDKV